MSQRWQPIQRSIHLSTDGSPGIRNRSAPGPACFGPGNCGVTRETGQTAVQAAQRIQTSELFWGQEILFDCFIQSSQSTYLAFFKSQIPNFKSQTNYKYQYRMTETTSVSPSWMVETPRLEAKQRLCEMVGQPLPTYLSRHCNEADHEHLNNLTPELSFPWKRESRMVEKKTGFLPAQE